MKIAGSYFIRCHSITIEIFIPDIVIRKKIKERDSRISRCTYTCKAERKKARLLRTVVECAVGLRRIVDAMEEKGEREGLAAAAAFLREKERAFFLCAEKNARGLTWRSVINPTVRAVFVYEKNSAESSRCYY